MKKQTISWKKKSALLKFDLSEVTLILANIIPIFGIIFLNRSVFNILFLYWVESAVIGFYWILKQIVSTIFGTAIPTIEASAVENIDSIVKGGNIIWRIILLMFVFCIIAFFIFHFGLFMLGHLMAISALTNSDVWRIILANEWDMLTNAFNGIKILRPLLSWTIICLFISHGTSFFANFIGKREYKKTEIGGLTMLEPYKRIILMQITIIFWAVLIALFNSPKALIVLLVILKILVDLRAHRKEHHA